MRYRIKIITYKTERKNYYAQKKIWYGWCDIGYNGDLVHAMSCDIDSREIALDRIDKNYDGNTKSQTIEFEYINKP